MIANALAGAGHTAYASMRSLSGKNAHQVNEVGAYSREHGVDLRTLELDVQSEEAAHAAVGRIIAEHGRLDVLVVEEHAPCAASSNAMPMPPATPPIRWPCVSRGIDPALRSSLAWSLVPWARGEVGELSPCRAGGKGMPFRGSARPA